MTNADKWSHPTRFTGDYPDGFNGFTFLDWDVNSKVFHPGDDYNFGGGWDDFTQDIGAIANGEVVHTSQSDKGYGNLVVIKHTLGYNQRRFLKDHFGIDTDVLYSLYAHLKDIVVAVGNEVDAGSLIGHLGTSGNSSSPHLHLELYKAIPGTGWRFYPSGWSKERVKEYYLSPYLWIEAIKNGEGVETFLGKSKEYWLAVEEQRTDLMNQLSGKDEQIADIIEKCNKRVEEVESEYKQKLEESANKLIKAEKSVETAQNEVTKLAESNSKCQEELIKAKNRIKELLEEQSEKLKIGEAFLILINVVKDRLLIKSKDNVSNGIS